jgi:hypothetical protein
LATKTRQSEHKMSHRRRTNPFRKSPKSPFDENGPNQAALRRAQEWFQTHDPNTPSPQVAEETRQPAEDTPTQTNEEFATQDAPANQPPSETQPDQIETAEPETDSVSVTEEEALPLQTSEPLDIPATEILESQPEPEPTGTELAQTEVIEAELVDLEDTQIERSQVRALQDRPRHPLVDSRRFPKRPVQPIDRERHERLCAICHHDERDAIELAFLQWHRTADIRYEFRLPSRSCIYRHAHAVGLLEQRAQAVRFVLENVMEECSNVESTGDTMIRAVRAYSCIDHRGRWVEPPRRVIIARELLPGPRAKRAKRARASRKRKKNRQR